jgi:hypothetical protein
MRFLTPLLFSLALAAPTRPRLPELSVSQWAAIQSGFTGGLRGLTSWSWSKAEELLDQVNAELPSSTTDGDETELTIWQQLKADPNSFSRLVKIIEVGRPYLV